jgi:hypothetical protein
MAVSRGEGRLMSIKTMTMSAALQQESAVGIPAGAKEVETIQRFRGKFPFTINKTFRWLTS